MYSVHFLLEKWRFCLTTQISWVWKPCEMKLVVWECGLHCGPVCGAGFKDTVEGQNDLLRSLMSYDGGSGLTPDNAQRKEHGLCSQTDITWSLGFLVCKMGFLTM